MKKYFAILFACSAFITTTSSAQQKIEKYCEVHCSERAFAINSVKVVFLPGKADSLFSFKDTTIRANLENVEQFQTITDVLNYMSSLNWELAAATGVGSEHYFYFKKIFDRSEISTP